MSRTWGREGGEARAGRRRTSIRLCSSILFGVFRKLWGRYVRESDPFLSVMQHKYVTGYMQTMEHGTCSIHNFCMERVGWRRAGTNPGNLESKNGKPKRKAKLLFLTIT